MALGWGFWVCHLGKMKVDGWVIGGFVIWVVGFGFRCFDQNYIVLDQNIILVLGKSTSTFLVHLNFFC